jgi:hypothetical protein
MIKLVIEAVIVGLIVALIGTAVTFVVSKITAVDLPPTCRVWKKNYTMEIVLFLTGILTHLAFEFVGGNTWYCKNGVACKKYHLINL